MSVLESTRDLLDVFIEQTDTIPQMLYNIQANLGLRPANMFKEDGEWKVITFNELLYKVENLAMGLMKIGVQSQDFIGIKAHTCVRWGWADLGLLFAGGASASVYPSLSRKQTVEIVTHCEMKYLMLGNRELLFDTLKFKDEMPGVKALICMEKGFIGNGEDIFGLDELMQMGADKRQDCYEMLKERVSSLNAESPAVLVYTSGTTADLKGVLHSHKDMLWASYRGQKGVANHKHSQNYNTVSMSVLPMSHILEKINSYYGPISCGAMIGYVDSPANILSDIQVIKPSWITLVPRLVSRLYLGLERAFSATEAGKKAWDWAMDVAVRVTYELEDEQGLIDTTIPFEEQLNGSLREEWIAANNTVYCRIKNALGGRVWDICVGGSVLESELHRKLTGMGGWSVVYGYGSTESTACMAQSSADCVRVGWTGELDPGVEAKLAEDGELLIRGHGIISSYYKNPEANAKSFTDDGWFKTGDIAEFDESGNLRVIDRKKGFIVLDTGKNVAASRIESLCEKHGVLDQVVIFGQDKKYIAAFVVPNLEVIVNMFRNNKIPFDESAVKYENISGMKIVVEVGEDIINKQFVQQAVKAAIDKVNSELESYESIKKYKVLVRRFSEKSGEVTPSQKMRMHIIRQKYRELIDELYSG